MKTCLGLFFSFFDLSDGSKVACAIIRSGLKSMHTWKSPKRHSIASCKQWAASKRCTRLAKVPVPCKQPEPHGSGGNQGRDHTEPTLAEPRNTLTASATGTAEHGQDTHFRDRSVQVWTPSSYHPLKWQDTSQLLSELTQSNTSTQQYFQTMSLPSGPMGFSNSSASYPNAREIPKCCECTHARMAGDLRPFLQPNRNAWSQICNRDLFQSLVKSPGIFLIAL